MKLPIRARRLIRIYAIAGVLTLALYAVANTVYVQRWRQTAQYSAALSFEETVRAVDNLSDALERSLYATDAAMSARLCSDVYASACAAESAMATLPFATQELEQLAGFLNRAGDYARSLCAAGRLGADERDTLAALAESAETMIGTLLDCREQLNGGALRMDTRERRLRNVGEETGTPLSTRLLDLEAGFDAPQALRYDGQYGRARQTEAGYLTEEEMLTAAAQFLGVQPGELSEAYVYEGMGGRRCYRWEDTFLCVSRAGVESVSQARLVGEANLTDEQAQQKAEALLKRLGYGEMSLRELRSSGTVAAMRFARVEDGALWPDNALSLAIALDDGSVYSFNSADYLSAPSGAVWALEETQAAQALPEGFTPVSTRRVILESEGGVPHGCFEFEGEGLRGETVRIAVDAETGAQRRIEIENET